LSSPIRTPNATPIPLIVPSRYHAYCEGRQRFSLSAAADFISEAGFDGVDLSFDTLPELNSMDGDEGWHSVLYAFGNRAAANGLLLPLCHLPFYMPHPDDSRAMARFSDEIRAAIRAASMLGIPDAVIHPIVRHGSMCSYDKWLSDNLALLSPLCEEATRRGVRLCIENMAGIPYPTHPSEEVYGSRATHITALADRLGKGVGLCWDFGHANLTGLCPFTELSELDDRLAAIHVHDNDGVRDTHRIPGEASHRNAVDWDAAALGLRLNGYAARAGRCMELELKTSDLPADRAVRLAHAARAIAAARTIAAGI
jgi:sugar phosphate isomerase/epimerase